MVSAKGRIFDNLLTEKEEYNQVAELLSDKNNLHIIFAKFRGHDKTVMSEKMILEGNPSSIPILL